MIDHFFLPLYPANCVLSCVPNPALSLLISGGVCCILFLSRWYSRSFFAMPPVFEIPPTLYRV